MILPDKKKVVYSAADLFMVTHAANILDGYGIDTIIENNFLSGAMGEIPVFECWPRLLVVNDEQFDRAMQIVSAELVNRQPGSTWVCHHCHESNEDNFDLCWSCGTEKNSTN